VATDIGGLVEARGGGVTRQVDNGGAILAFTYAGESPGTDGAATAGSDPARGSGGGDSPGSAPALVPGSLAGRTSGPPLSRPSGPPPPFTRAQVTAGKTAYDASCAVCHGSTLVNGTFGTPLAGEYFRRQWSGRSVAELFEKSRTTMPPSAVGSLPATTHAAIVAYVLEVNGSTPGDADLPADASRLTVWRVP
jgi:mono/diheme cytochrome c family protein